VNSGPIIEARGLTKRYGALVALDGIDLAVDAGQSLAIFGPNGAGKTTLTRILATNLRASEGSLRIGGRDPRVHDRETKAMIGLISHQTFLYDDLSARDNLVFFGRLYGAPRPEEGAEALLESVGLADRAEDPVRTFSRGMQQRLSLARSLIHEPRIVFLDEPFTGLDPHAASVLQSTLERLRLEKRTLLVTTHDLPRGLGLSDRWVILSKGRIAGEGVSAAVDRSTFEDEYFAYLSRAPRPEQPS
jgi:heme exporter protein A